MIRHINKFNSESWEFLPWKKFQVNLFRLQKRVYKAVRAGDTRKARSLQKDQANRNDRWIQLPGLELPSPEKRKVQKPSLSGQL